MLKVVWLLLGAPSLSISSYSIRYHPDHLTQAITSLNGIVVVYSTVVAYFMKSSALNNCQVGFSLAKFKSTYYTCHKMSSSLPQQWCVFSSLVFSTCLTTNMNLLSRLDHSKLIARTEVLEHFPHSTVGPFNMRMNVEHVNLRQIFNEWNKYCGYIDWYLMLLVSIWEIYVNHLYSVVSESALYQNVYELDPNVKMTVCCAKNTHCLCSSILEWG